MPTTEEAPNEETQGKKRPAPLSTAKKGTAKKGPPAKKRKSEVSLEPKSQRSKAPGARGNLKKGPSASATPLNSSPAPRSIRTASSPPADLENADTGTEDVDDEEEPGTPGPDEQLYCICRRADTGTFMIGCDSCDDWFHGKCVGVEEKNQGLIDRYICPNCEKKGGGTTTWKRMCRREGCRLPARVSKKKGEPPSKYCSDECGVIFFRDAVGRSRGADAGGGRRGSKRKSMHGADTLGHTEDDLGPRGGALSAGELKALVVAASNIDSFKRLGEGVLSPPATPPAEPIKGEAADSEPDAVLNTVEMEKITEIRKVREELRTRHNLLKDKVKFITMLKQAAIQLADEKGIKAKEMCGYDSRMTWDDERFDKWRSTKAGSESLASGVLTAERKDADGDAEMRDRLDDDHNNNDDDEAATVEVCTKRKCARHYDWSKLALDDTRFELSGNSDRMRELEKEEKDVRERAGLRVRELKAGVVGGSVEVHEDVAAGQDTGVAVGNAMAGQATRDVTDTTGGEADAAAASEEQVDAVKKGAESITTNAENVSNEQALGSAPMQEAQMVGAAM